MEKETQQIQLNVDPNIYSVTNININFDEENFYLGLISGGQMRQFSVSPKHAKRALLLLEKHLSEYEKQFGKLETQLPKAPQMSQEEKKFGF